MDKFNEYSVNGLTFIFLFKGRHYTIYCIMDKYDQYKENGLTFMSVAFKRRHYVIHHIKDNHVQYEENGLTFSLVYEHQCCFFFYSFLQG